MTTPSRIRCNDCGLYFEADHGISVVGYCFACLPPYFLPDPAACSRYLGPVVPPEDLEKIALNRALTRTRLALYFLYEAMAGTEKSINPVRSTASAMALFHRNFPDFIGPIGIDIQNHLADAD